MYGDGIASLPLPLLVGVKGPAGADDGSEVVTEIGRKLGLGGPASIDEVLLLAVLVCNDGGPAERVCCGMRRCEGGNDDGTAIALPPLLLPLLLVVAGARLLAAVRLAMLELFVAHT